MSFHQWITWVDFVQIAQCFVLTYARNLLCMFNFLLNEATAFVLVKLHICWALTIVIDWVIVQFTARCSCLKLWQSDSDRWVTTARVRLIRLTRYISFLADLGHALFRVVFVACGNRFLLKSNRLKNSHFALVKFRVAHRLRPRLSLVLIWRWNLLLNFD